MPCRKLTGIELAKQILNTRPEMPIILCSGFSELINEKEALKIGICKYLSKPIETNTLSEAIREVLDTSTEFKRKTLHR